MNANAVARAPVTVPPPPGSRWSVRAYGIDIADLDTRFGQAPAFRHDASTAQTAVEDLLCQCLRNEAGQPPAAGTLATWTLARRLQALLQVRLADQPQARVAVATTCGACHAEFGFELELTHCLQPHGHHVDPPPLSWTSPEGYAISLRLPRAADLLTWQAQGLHSGAQLAAALVETVDGMPPGANFMLPDRWAQSLSERLAEVDPFSAMSVVAACPDCGQHNDVAVDLEGLLLEGFARQQRELLDDVARIAAVFHWSEAQIFALPAWRRTRYLARIDTMEAA